MYWYTDISLTSASAGSSEFSSSVTSSSMPRLTEPRFFKNINWTHKQWEKSVKQTPISREFKVVPTDSQRYHNALCLLYLEAVLISYEVVCFALVDALRLGSGCLRRYRAPCGFIGTFTQVQVCHMCTYFISDKVLELWGGNEKKIQLKKMESVCNRWVHWPCWITVLSVQKI